MENNKLTKNEKREQAREEARIRRDKDKKQAKVRRIAIWGSVGLVVVAIIAIVALVISMNANKEASQQNQTYPKNMQSDGVVFTSSTEALTQKARAVGDAPVHTNITETGKVNIAVYVDYSCPHCAEFEAENADTLNKWLDAGLITLAVHPVAVLANEYAPRGANAAACVADIAPEIYLDFQKEAFKQAYGTSGLTNRTLRDIAKGLNPGDAKYNKIASCINDNSFSRWVEDSTYTALSKGTAATDGSTLQGTPTILVNGVLYPYSYENDVFTSVIESILNGGTIEAPTTGEGTTGETTTIG